MQEETARNLIKGLAEIVDSIDDLREELVLVKHTIASAGSGQVARYETPAPMPREPGPGGGGGGYDGGDNPTGGGGWGSQG